MRRKNLNQITPSDKNLLMFRLSYDKDRFLPAVKAIIKDVKKRKDNALIEYTEKFDGVKLTDIEVGTEEFEETRKTVDSEALEALKESARNIREFHQEQMPKDWSFHRDSATLGQVVRPLKTVGCYVPGGRASYPSSVLMTAITAKIAGVEEVVVVTPPGKDGKINPLVLVAAEIAGVDHVYKVGGAQAIAALAYGTETIDKVEKIVGPGNIYVTLAKGEVWEDVGIDNMAGPSEVLIIADDTADPNIVAWDMAAQAEHDPRAMSVLVTTSDKVASGVEKEIAALKFPRPETKESLDNNGYILVAETLDEAVAFSNDFAPEHLQIITKDPRAVLEGIESAGSVFLGPMTPVALGDYASGTNHVLPTAGYARIYSGLSVYDFLKFISVQEFDKEALEKIAKTVTTLAEAEGLVAHAETVKKRLEKK